MIIFVFDNKYFLCHLFKYASGALSLYSGKINKNKKVKRNKRALKKKWQEREFDMRTTLVFQSFFFLWTLVIIIIFQWLSFVVQLSRQTLHTHIQHTIALMKSNLPNLASGEFGARSPHLPDRIQRFILKMPTATLLYRVPVTGEFT